MAIQEEEVLGKAYDARLMRRLLTYLRKYQWQVAVALVAIVLKAGADVLGPYLTKVAIDKYLANHTEAHSLLDRFLSRNPLTGIAQIAGMYMGLLLFSFLLEFAQTYIMQWTGQKVMFDLRRRSSATCSACTFPSSTRIRSDAWSRASPATWTR